MVFAASRAAVPVGGRRLPPGPAVLNCRAPRPPARMHNPGPVSWRRPLLHLGWIYFSCSTAGCIWTVKRPKDASLQQGLSHRNLHHAAAPGHRSPTSSIYLKKYGGVLCDTTSVPGWYPCYAARACAASMKKRWRRGGIERRKGGIKRTQSILERVWIGKNSAASCEL